MLQSDAMQDSDSMLVYADYMEEMGYRNQSFGIRGVGYFLKQAEEVLQVKIIPTGSRLYGQYWRPSSDWDWLAPPVNNSVLVALGWNKHYNPSLNTLYMGMLNLIIPKNEDEYSRMLGATNKCVEEKPETKERTIEIWKQFGIFPPSPSSQRDNRISLSEI